MLERQVKERRVIGMYANDQVGITSSSIYQWSLTKSIIWVTKRFSSTSAFNSEIIVEIQVLLRYLGIKDNDEEVQTMKSELRDSINARFLIKGEILKKRNFSLLQYLTQIQNFIPPPESLDSINNLIIQEIDI